MKKLLPLVALLLAGCAPEVPAPTPPAPPDAIAAADIPLPLPLAYNENYWAAYEVKLKDERCLLVMYHGYLGWDQKLYCPDYWITKYGTSR